jgi:hypothetical protein
VTCRVKKTANSSVLQIWHLRATADRAPNLEIVFVRAMHSHVHSYVSWAACMLMLSCTIPAAPVIWKRHSWFANVVDTVPARRSTIVLRGRRRARRRFNIYMLHPVSQLIPVSSLNIQ